MGYSAAKPHEVYKHAAENLKPAEQVLALYNACIVYIQQAKDADQQNDHNARYALVDKTIAILRGLRECLNFEGSEEVANALNKYYESLELLLVNAQSSENKAEVCDKVIENIRIIKAVWEDINLSTLEDGKEEFDTESGESDQLPIILSEEQTGRDLTA